MATEEFNFIRHQNSKTTNLLERTKFNLQSLYQNTTAWHDLKEFVLLYLSGIILKHVKLVFPIVSVIICGQLGTLELDAVSTASSVSCLTCTAFTAGFSFAVDTIFSQIYAEENIRKRLGTSAQKIFILLNMFSLVLFSLFILMEPILLGFNQNPVVAKMASYYLLVWSPCIFLDVIVMLLNRYLLIIDRKKVVVISIAIAFLINIGSQILCIHVLHLSFLWSAGCQILSYIIIFVIDIVYIIKSKVYQHTWEGIHCKEAFQDWTPSLKLLASSGILNVTSFIIIDAGVFCSALHGIIIQAEYSVIYNLFMIMCVTSVPMGIAINIKLAKLLGANQVERIKPFLNLSYMFLFIVALLLSILLVCLRDYTPRLFTTSTEVTQKASKDMIYLATSYFMSALVFFNSSIIFSTARHFIVLIGIYITQVFIGLPLFLTLFLATNLEVAGILIGSIISFFTEASIYAIFIVLTNWNEHTQLGGTFQLKLDEVDASQPLLVKSKVSLLRKVTGVVKLVVVVTILLIFISAIIMRLTIFYNLCIPVQFESLAMNVSNQMDPMIICHESSIRVP